VSDEIAIVSKPPKHPSIARIFRLFMAALCTKAGHYIFALWFLLLFLLLLLLSFSRLISAVADWMSTILPYMMWP